ncbi:hypothetical protein RB195_012826 [Necator americanus]|uniref:Secreted protein n=1 Tax=Necator americanus TaxID=51031 RepID=A0ABR1DSP6_NECAM
MFTCLLLFSICGRPRPRRRFVTSAAATAASAATVMRQVLLSCSGALQANCELLAMFPFCKNIHPLNVA